MAARSPSKPSNPKHHRKSSSEARNFLNPTVSPRPPYPPPPASLASFRNFAARALPEQAALDPVLRAEGGKEGTRGLLKSEGLGGGHHAPGKQRSS